METSDHHVGTITRSNQHHVKSSTHLPTELILLILIHLDCRTLLAATSTCRRWHELAQEYSQSLWKHLAWRDFSFTAARGYWKLEFLKDRSLSAMDIRRTRRHYFRKNSEENKQTSISAEKRVPVAADPCDISEEQDDGYRCSSRSQRQKGKQRDVEWHPDNTDIKTRSRDDQKQECQDDEHEQVQALSQEPDWKALYQLTSNWYRGRARGYCPLMLPSLAALASATEALSLSATGSASSKSIPSTYAQRNIHRILAKRKPAAVVGLQHEGSALTDVSLISHPDRRSSSKTRRDGKEWRCRTTLLRSNPHYREKRSPTLAATTTIAPASASTAQRRKQQPNIMTQDPLEHDQIAFAISTAPPSQQANDSSQGTSDGALLGSHHHQQQTSQSASPVSSQPSPPPELEINDHHPADDIICHYSSAKNSLLLTGHMDGSVRLWDLSIEEPGQQCIRLWRTGSRRRVLSVGMNSKVVVCGNADSTLCVWDIYPPHHITSSAFASSSSSSSYGTIHAGSYLATSLAVPAPGQDDWVSGIEHICVGESLVSCSTDFSGSVLVFSLATGSLVYEIPGLYQPSKMCMTEFFLLTGGRGGRDRPHMQEQQNQPTGLRLNRDATETDEESTCCINVWDLRTGNLLYSLIPQLPMHQLQHVQDIATILSNPVQPQRSTSRSQKMQKSSQINAFGTTDMKRDLSLSSNLSGSGTSRGKSGKQPYNTLSLGPPQNPMSTPLTLLDIAVTDDHSTLLVTLCERSGKGREGVYCWDFTGSYLEGSYQDPIVLPTVALDQNDLEYEHEQDFSWRRDSSCDTAYNNAEMAHDHGSILISDEFSNNMVMQQVDATALKNLHQARITGKMWIAWQQGEEVSQEYRVQMPQVWST
ncbi:hypothetical protein BGZ51_004882 [Haplosporangium sp. Z 767]|nr:hypothetical protein BGZ51_004882 [Haplosporangium sp. Z 767]KAF9182477.1 hypothetical protein BGZ50_004906 [Haplosporangium sp. Z 11]